MIKQSLKSLDSRLIKAIRKSDPIQNSPQLENFYLHIVILHEKIKRYLYPPPLPSSTEHQIDEKSETSEIKSLHFELENLTPNEEESFFPPEEFKPKSLNRTQPTTKSHKNQNVISLANSRAENERFEKIMENISLLIGEYSQVENTIFIAKSNEMGEMYSNENVCSLNEQNVCIKAEGTESSYFKCVKENIEKVILECKEIEETFKDFNPLESFDKKNSETESNDKKSLLTEMLRESEGIESESESIQSPKKNGKRIMSEHNSIPQANKKLLKEIDFSNYRIDGIHPKKEKKVGLNKCGQCAECTIF